MERVLGEGRGWDTKEGRKQYSWEKIRAGCPSCLDRDGFAGLHDDDFSRTNQQVTLWARLPYKSLRFLPSIVYKWKSLILTFFKYT